MILETIAQHRLLSTSQLVALADADAQAVRRQLRLLRGRGHVESLRIGPRGDNLHWATDAGYRAAGVAVRHHRMRRDAVLDPSRGHLLGVNEVGIAFVRAARAAGHDCGPLDWDHEVDHRWGRHETERVVVDAVLRYVDDEGELVRFVEYDRGTYSVSRLVAKVTSFAALLDRPEVWRPMYRAFPRLIVVVDHRAGDRRSALRIAQVAEACSALPPSELVVSLTTLTALRAPGPWARVFTVPGESAPVDLLGRTLVAA